MSYCVVRKATELRNALVFKSKFDGNECVVRVIKVPCRVMILFVPHTRPGCREFDIRAELRVF
eukprot:653546-Hanusia_phi.AAC.2